MTDVTRLYRKEEMLKKKLKVLLDSNGVLEKEIKNHEAEIKDERASVQFQLNDLLVLVFLCRKKCLSSLGTLSNKNCRSANSTATKLLTVQSNP